MRQRFKVDRICSSDNYTLSRKIHKAFLMEEHKENTVAIKQIFTETSTKKAYVKCFGKLIPLTENEVYKIEESVTVIWL